MTVAARFAGMLARRCGPRQYQPSMSKRSRQISTPCIDVCELDERGICVGCRRTRQQIAQWSQLSERERRRIMLTLTAQRGEAAVPRVDKQNSNTGRR